jgi:predicted Fe-S protein YdhL (DUF1289 family)
VQKVNNNQNGVNAKGTSPNILEAASAIQRTLEEILIWLKISNSEKVNLILRTHLNSPEKRLVYHLSDGRSTREISAISSVSISAISTYWKKWNRLGLTRKVGVKGGGERHFKNFDLDGYDMEVRDIPFKKQKISDLDITSGEET